MIPTVDLKKQDGNTGVVRPGDTGILAIIAAAADGAKNTPSGHNDETLAKAEFSWGPLSSMAAYVMPVTRNPVLLVRSDPSIDGAYGSITKVGGTSVATADATVKPYDDFDVYLVFPHGGTIGVAGITYQWSLDGGKTLSKVLNLGTATNITLADANVKVDFGSGNVIDGETISFKTTRPRANNTDLVDSLEALRVTSSPFEAVLIDCFADDDTVTLVASWLADMNKQGKYPEVFLTTRPLGSADPDETETEYKDDLAGVIADSVSLDTVLCADECDLVDAFRAIEQHRPVGLAVAAKSMSVDIGTEPAEVSTGALSGAKIMDARGNPLHHNEEKYPGLDALRLTTLRTITGEQGVFITNTNLLSPSGSDFVYLPHARCMNRAAEITFQLLTKQLSRGVPKNPKVGPNGERYIDETAARHLEELVNDAVRNALKGKVDDIQFRLSRTDDISSNTGATITCFLESVALAYVKKFVVTARYVKAIAQSTGT